MFTASVAVGAREVGGAQVKEDGRKVGRGLAGCKSKIRVVEFATPMGINSPLVQALGHNEKPCAFTTRIVQGTETPKKRVARCRELWVCKHVTDSGESTHVEVATNEIDAVLNHVSVKTSEQVSGGIVFLGHNIVAVY